MSSSSWHSIVASYSIIIAAISTKPMTAARWSGVCPEFFCTSTLAPFLRRNSTSCEEIFLKSKKKCGHVRFAVAPWRTGGLYSTMCKTLLSSVGSKTNRWLITQRFNQYAQTVFRRTSCQAPVLLRNKELYTLRQTSPEYSHHAKFQMLHAL